MVLSFVVAGIACAFAGLCYAEMASMIPIAGTAYTYAYATMGELVAWIIGWDLILEYVVGAADGRRRLVGLRRGVRRRRLGITLPADAGRARPFVVRRGAAAVVTSHRRASSNVPAMFDRRWLVTVILVVGIKESARFNA